MIQTKVLTILAVLGLVLASPAWLSATELGSGESAGSTMDEEAESEETPKRASGKPIFDEDAQTEVVAVGDKAPSSVDVRVRTIRAIPGTGEQEIPQDLADLKERFDDYPFFVGFKLLSTDTESIKPASQKTYTLEGEVTMTVTVHEIEVEETRMHVRIVRKAKVVIDTTFKLHKNASMIFNGPKLEGDQIFYVITLDYPAATESTPKK